MSFGIAMIVIGYAVMYWGWHHFSGFDCPSATCHDCRYSLTQILGLNRLGITPGQPVQYR